MEVKNHNNTQTEKENILNTEIKMFNIIKRWFLLIIFLYLILIILDIYNIKT